MNGGNILSHSHTRPSNCREQSERGSVSSKIQIVDIVHNWECTRNGSGKEMSLYYQWVMSLSHVVK